MTSRTGALYRVHNRLYADSQAVLSLTGNHDVVPHAGGWRVLTGGGAVMCTMVEDQPPLPNQRGALYVLTAEGDVGLKDMAMAWCTQGLMHPVGSYDAWPGVSACSHGCACAPCRARPEGSDEAAGAALDRAAALDAALAGGVTMGPPRGTPGVSGATKQDDPTTLLRRAARATRQGKGPAAIAAFAARARAVGGTPERVAQVAEELAGLLRGDPVSHAIIRELLTLAELEETLGVTLDGAVEGEFSADLRDSVADVLTGLAAIPGLSTGRPGPEGGT